MIGVKNDDASVNDINIVKQDDYPGDTISSITWAPSTQVRMFSTSSWDSKVRIYEAVVQSMTEKGLVQKACLDVEDPCLCTSWSDDLSKLFAGCVNNTVKAFDLSTGQSVNVGQHEGPVKSVFWISPANTLCTLSFDKTIRFWDLRQQNPVAGYNLGQKVYCADYAHPNIVMGMGEEKILLVNLPNMQNMLGKNTLDYIESPLGKESQITAIEFFSDGYGIGLASHDGRANLSKIEQDNMGRIKLTNVMTFKCHKVDQGNGNQPQNQLLYPVHAIGFHPKSKNFVYTAGGEGSMFFWDYGAKNKITGFNYNRVPITRAKMSPDGLLLAYSLGYDWAKGIEGYMSYKPKVCCHIMQDNELVYTGK